MANQPSFKLVDIRTVKFRSTGNDFRILSMKNTTMYRAGDHLSEKEVNELINTCEYNVDIRERKK